MVIYSVMPATHFILPSDIAHQIHGNKVHRLIFSSGFQLKQSHIENIQTKHNLRLAGVDEARSRECWDLKNDELELE